MKVLSRLLFLVVIILSGFGIAKSVEYTAKIKSRVFLDMPRTQAKFVKRFISLKHQGRTYGTGFNMKYKGKFYIISNRHVCKVSGRLGYPNKAVVNGKVHTIIKQWKKHDLCALESDIKDGLELANQDSSPLDKIVLIGHPRGLDLVIRGGRIVSEDIRTCIQYTTGVHCYNADRISALAYGGNSGSPVLNRWGRVVGVLFAGSPSYPHETLVVPYEFLKEFLDSLDME